MISTTSSFKEFLTVFRFSFKARLSAMIVNTILLFLSIPFILIFVFENSAYATYSSYYSSLTGFLKVVIPLFAIPSMLVFVMINAAALFKYMHQKRSVDLFHSMPLKRTPLLLGRCFSGIIAIWIPFIVNMIIVEIICMYRGVVSFECTVLLLSYIGKYLLFSAACFAFAMLFAVCSGTTGEMFISGIIFTIVWPLTIVISQAMMGIIISGYSYQTKPLLISAFSPAFASIMPYISEFFGSDADVGTWFYVWWVLAFFVMTLTSVLIYKKRKSEYAEDITSFAPFKKVIRFFAIISASLAFGLMFFAIFETNLSFILGLLFTSVVTHIMIQVLYTHSLKDLGKTFLQYSAAIGAMIIFIALCSTGFLGYDIKMPEADDIEYVSIRLPYNFCNEIGVQDFNRSDCTFYKNGETDEELLYTTGAKYREADEIKIILDINKQLNDLNRKNIYPYTLENVGKNGDYFTFTYKLKNGRDFVRKIAFAEDAYNYSEEYYRLITLGKESTQIKDFYKQYNIAFYIEPSYINAITLSGKWSSEGLNLSNEAKKELLDALIDDSHAIMDFDYEESIAIQFSFESTFEIKEGDRLNLLTGYTGEAHTASKWQYISVNDKCENFMKVARKYGWDIKSLNEDTYGYEE